LLIADCQLARPFARDQLAIGNLKTGNVHGGEGGIRTHGGRKPTPVFETGALIHYATSPQVRHQMSEIRFTPRTLTSDL
jgi:hypothetical protein